MARRPSCRKHDPEGVFRRLAKAQLTPEDAIAFGGLAEQFRLTQYWPLLLAVTAREREQILLNRDLMHSLRPDFVLGMLHENAVIENALDALIAEKRRLLEARARDGSVEVPAPDADPQLGQARYRDRFGDA